MSKKKLIKLIIVMAGFSMLIGALMIFFAQFKSDNNGKNSREPGSTDKKEVAYFSNPVKGVNFPDPYVYKHTDGYYYGMATTASNIILYKSDKLTNLFTTGQSKVIWTPPETGDHSKDLWAPEIHYIDETWYVYYSAGSGDFNQRTFCISNSNPDPFSGTWEDRGKIYVEGADYWAIDGTVLRQNGKLYFVFSGWEPNTGGTQHIFIAEMSSPTRISGKRVKLSSPQYDWEKRVNVNGEPWVNEGPQVLQKNGKTFIVYSASFCHSPYYCLGLLTCDSNADPMQKSNWKKSSTPVFQSGNGIYGPGHCSFTTSPDGTEDWIVYHARTTTDKDEERKVSMQKFTWNEDGTPNFGTPVRYGTALEVPSGQEDSGVIIYNKSTYRLKNMQTNLYLDVSEASTKAGALIIQNNDNDTDSQKWSITDCYDGTFRLTAIHSRKNLDNKGGSKEPGSPAQQWWGNNSDEQKWYIIDIGSGYCKLINKASGLVLTASDNPEKSGAAVFLEEDKNLPAQRWKLELFN